MESMNGIQPMYDLADRNNNEFGGGYWIRELEAFLNAMYGILEEMKTSSDFQEEREMVRDKLREMFSVYQ